MSLRPTNTKQQAREAIERHTAAYKAKGGVIEVLPPLEYTYRLFTVSGGGSGGDDLMLYASKRDASTGERGTIKVKKWQRGRLGGGYDGI